MLGRGCLFLLIRPPMKSNRMDANYESSCPDLEFTNREKSKQDATVF
jgi:hypothetical protein